MSAVRHRHRSALLALALGLLGLVALPAATALAAPGPAWDLSLISSPTNFAPGASAEGGFPQYTLLATNVGGGPTSGTVTVTETLPEGFTPHLNVADPCGAVGRVVTCTFPGPVAAARDLTVKVPVDVDPGLQEGATVEVTASVSGGGAEPATTTTTTTISASLPAFDFLAGRAGFASSVAGIDGQPFTAAGAHPGTLVFDLNFPSIKTGVNPAGTDGGVRDVHTYLPHGLIVNPAATEVRCTEVQLEGPGGCPAASSIGFNDLLTSILSPAFQRNAVFNMVPPPGAASSFGFNGAGVGIFVHILGGLRPGDYTEVGHTENIPNRGGNPVMGVHLQLWGDPSDTVHDQVRGEGCVIKTAPVCPPAIPASTPFISMPTSCAEAPQTDATADSWGHPAELRSRAVPLGDAGGDPIAVSDCGALHFEPTLEARPTTNQGDSPTGLSADLHLPQAEGVEALRTAHLRKAVVTLPKGLVLNPSSANGLEGCSSAQVGIDPATGIADGARPTCPDAARIGSAEVVTPLLDHAVQGSVYAATPDDNPFGSLLAIYLVLDDPQTGVLIKLAGQVVANPDTGRLVTTFDENPQLPFSDFKLHFFGGPAAVLRTPAVCGSYSTTSQMTPWSAPDSGPPATPHDDYAISSHCASSEGALPNSPEFEAGTVAPIAGKYTPFVFHLRREDGSQEFSQVTVTPPPGLIGKLAGIAYCPDAALAAAEGKSGNEERANPSCPAATRIGTVNVAAGAGPAPYWTQGAAYLTGPYKGAPLGMAVIVPATAGPYDLGTVVTRVALRVNSETAQVSADADPIPRILEGILLDVRQVNVSLDRDQFTRTGTSCNPLSVSGQLVSTLGQGASLSNPFQLGNCTNLRFKPKLGLRLLGKTGRGGNPALRATLSMVEGSANIAKAVVALPHSEFIDQGHFRTICTRVQFNAGPGHGAQCPSGSVYGHARAISPLLDDPLEGPAILRSSSHELPDLVIALHGQIDVEAVGVVDSVKGGIRTTFEALPDAPVSKFTLSMQGGKKGLFENSTNICKGVHRASAAFDAQNGAAADLDPALASPKCPSSRSRKGHRRSQRVR